MSFVTKLQTGLTNLTQAQREYNKQVRDSQSVLKELEKALKLDPKNVELLESSMKNLGKMIENNAIHVKKLEDAFNKALKDPNIDKTSKEFITLENNLQKAKAQGIQFNAEFFKLEKQLTEVGKEVKDTAKELNALDKIKINLANMIKTEGLAGTVIIAKGIMDATQALINAVGGAVKEYANFEKTIISTSKKMKLTEAQTEELANFTKELGRTTAFSSQQVAEGMDFMALAGYNLYESMSALPVIMDASVATGQDLATISDALTDNLGAWGLSVEDLTDYTDNLVIAQTECNQSLLEFTNGMKVAGPIARSAGQSVESTTIALGLLADAGVKGSEGGTAVRNILMALQTPTDSVTKLFSKLGLQTRNVATGEMLDLFEILGNLKNILASMNTEEQDRILSKIFNVTDLGPAKTLLATSTERMEELNIALQNSKGATKEFSDAMSSGVEGSLNSFNSAVDGTTQALGELFGNLFKEIEPFLSAFFGELTKFVESFKPLFERLGGFLTAVFSALAPILEAFFSIANVYFQTFFDFVFWLFERFVGSVKNDFEIIKTAITIVIDFLTPYLEEFVKFLIDSFNKFANAMGVIWEAIKTVIVAVFEFIAPIVETTVNFLVDLFGEFLDVMTTIWDSILTIITSVIQLVQTVIELFVTLITELFSGFFEETETETTEFDEFLKTAIDGILKFITVAIEILLGIIAVALQSIKPILELLFTFIKTAIEILTAAIKITMEIITNIIKTGVDLATNIIKFFASIIKGDLGGAVEGIQGIFNTAFEAIKQGFQSVVDFFKNGVNAIKGLFDGIKNAVSGIVNSVKGVFGFKSLPMQGEQAESDNVERDNKVTPFAKMNETYFSFKNNLAKIGEIIPSQTVSLNTSKLNTTNTQGAITNIDNRTQNFNIEVKNPRNVDDLIEEIDYKMRKRV